MRSLLHVDGCSPQVSSLKSTALVIGINGQDGVLLAPHLAKNGLEVFGLGRQGAPAPEIRPQLSKYVSLDVSCREQLLRCLKKLSPDYIFYAAAVHGSHDYCYEDQWERAHNVNILGFNAVLDYSRVHNTSCKIYLFSSGKVFRKQAQINEHTPQNATCIYTITKVAAQNLAQYYRSQFGLNTSVLYFFNHESTRRPDSFFVPRILEILRKSKADRKYKGKINTLDFWCDWGCADEYMSLLAGGLDQLAGNDVIFATGDTVWARDVVDELFREHSLNYGDHILEEQRNSTPRELKWVASNSKLCRLVKNEPMTSGLDVFMAAQKLS